MQTEETKASVLQQLDKEKDLLRSEKTNLLKLQEILSQKEKENAELLRNLHSRQQKVVSLERELEQIKARNENEVFFLFMASNSYDIGFINTLSPFYVLNDKKFTLHV